MSDVALELHKITKRFGSVTALQDVSLTLRRNSIHALLGENGAGKTTLMRVAFGMIRPDDGWIAVKGRRTTIASPADAIAMGIGMVHQQFSLVPAMTVAENVALGGRGLFRHDAVAHRLSDIGERTGLYLRPDSLVADLSSTERQKLEIIRTLAHEATVLILDEPTAVLTPRDVEDLFAQLRLFADHGGSVVLITHKLDDALAHADEVTVLRHGRSVMSASVVGLNRASLTTAMLGVTPGTTGREPQLHKRSTVVAAFHNVTLRGTRGVPSSFMNLEVFGGEILGVAALEGAAGPLLRALAGRLRPDSGEVRIPVHVGYVPENRQEEALVPDFSVTENFALKDAGRRQGLAQWGQMRQLTANVIRQFGIHVSGPEARAREMSGGNQQRFVVGRELEGNPPLLVLDNPTQGLDVSAAASVHERIRTARNMGTAIVFYSSDLDELVELADRVIVANASGLIFSPPDRDLVGNLLLSAVRTTRDG